VEAVFNILGGRASGLHLVKIETTGVADPTAHLLTFLGTELEILTRLDSNFGAGGCEKPSRLTIF